MDEFDPKTRKMIFWLDSENIKLTRTLISQMVKLMFLYLIVSTLKPKKRNNGNDQSIVTTY